ncbi:ferritin family protein [Varunaivibrio sulfuroxidans]|uniref:Rubrerythrin n=1 Tax=Varunaivibrio sulfuroxidans TaxID=1773489 RepID=A0A4R3JF22_9PROT|nr:ferritin family protein [Varunaivibrio sulfuroxidans]TCS64688.1 rubrerythrin [Varunaivibrio sulfuroxidans]WES30005.1 ferritin family protein [Varunaivibrio sulfuroxidans]
MTGGHGYDKLKPLTKLKDILDVATEFERTARDFYADLIPKVGKNLRYLVEDLAAEEQRHLDLFSGLAQRSDLEQTLSAQIERPASDRKFSDCVHLPDLGEHPDDQAVLQYALMREHAAMEQYHALAQSTPSGPVQDLFTYLANEETKHKNELEALYYEIVHSGGV